VPARFWNLGHIAKVIERHTSTAPGGRCVILVGGMSRFWNLAAIAVCLGCSGRLAPAQPPGAVPRARVVATPPGVGTLAPPALSFLQRYCYPCHGDGKSKGGLALDEALASLAGKPLGTDAPADQRELWQEVLARIESRDMPPEEHAQPTDDERAQLAAWVDTGVFGSDCDRPDPGRVTLHRLNRAEYQNSIRDLLGVDLPLAEWLPVDDSGHGFDNIADVLTTSPLLMERYLAAADRALSAVIFDPRQARPRRRVLTADLLEVSHAARPLGDGWVVLESGEEDDVAAIVDIPFESTFVVRATARAWEAPARHGAGKSDRGVGSPSRLSVRPELTFLVGERPVQRVAVSRRPGVYEARVSVPPGRHRLRAAFQRDKSGLSAFEAGLRGTGRKQTGAIAVQALEIVGPLGASAGPSDAHRRLFFMTPAEGRHDVAARAILARFAARAYRRPVDPEELDRLVELAARAWSSGASFELGVRQSLRAVLMSPRFLFRFGGAFAAEGPGGPQSRPLDDFALASRLSYFLWSSAPDDVLMTEAQQGTLRAHLDEQVVRMLADPRAGALVDGFGAQWLHTRRLDGVAPAWDIFKTWNEALRRSMKRETQLLLRSLFAEDLSVMTVLDADHTFVNERLARFYGLEGFDPNDGLEAEDFRRVSLHGSPRRGVITHGGILTLTSSSTRTSPVKRGKWVLEVLLDAEPPPPPPDVPPLSEGPKASGTLRERLEAHRADPACATCHARMDPIGFGLESFDAIGRYRSTDNGLPVDASGALDAPFEGARQLVDVLSRHYHQDFARAFARKLLTFALGRGLGPTDRCAVKSIVDQAADDGYRASAFVRAIVRSAPFGHARPNPNPTLESPP
jgi:hypothetical protein